MKHRLRTPQYELLRSWHMPMSEAVKISKDMEQLSKDLATFHNPPIEEVVEACRKAIMEPTWWGIRI